MSTNPNRNANLWVAFLVVLTVAGVLVTLAAQRADASSRTPVPKDPGAVSVVLVESNRLPGTPKMIREMIAGYNKSPYVNMSRSTSCTPGAFCVYVRTGRGLDDDGIGGRAVPSFDHVDGVPVGSVNVSINRTGPRPYQGFYVEILCHEVGHALGLDHPLVDEPGRGCLSTHAIGTPMYSMIVPTPYDLRELGKVFNGTSSRALGWGALDPHSIAP